MEKPILIREIEPRNHIKKNGYIERVKRGLFKCYCGKEFTTTFSLVSSGHTKSCGCIRNKKRPHTTKHGQTGTCEHYTWSAIKARCNIPTHKAYKWYGARGITVCDRWLDKKEGFQNFLQDMGKRPGKEYSLDRIDNNKGYCKENCKWSTMKEQTNNRRSNRVIEYKGERHTMSEWSDITGIGYAVIKERIYANWSTEEVLTTPVRVW